jgi:hypothetical protein
MASVRRQTFFAALYIVLLLLYPSAETVTLQVHSRTAVQAVRAPPNSYASAETAARCVAAQNRRLDDRLYDEVLSAPRLPGARPLGVAVPLHEPKFEYALAQVEACHSLKTRGAIEASEIWDFYAVFTGSQAADAFANLVMAHNPEMLLSYAAVVMQPSYIEDSRIPQNDQQSLSMVDLKHTFALAALHPCYENLIIMDADASIIKPEHLAKAARRRLADKRFFVVATDSPVLIEWGPNYATRCFPTADLPAVEHFLKDYTLFGWWNDLPAYDTKAIPAYLKYINYPRQVS